MTIAVLSADVAAKIAAGEVVERPASIVKELVDNALDAGARRIVVEIEGGGIRLIRVSDDGSGLTATELPLAFLRHATSKLRQPEDLASVATLGFRGEALPSIAAAADVDFASRAAGAEAGALIRVRSGDLSDRAGYGGARGTVVSVRELFERQPARRKFLRSVSSETGQIATLVGLYAIAYPEVAFTLIGDGRRSLVTSGSGDRRESAARVYGAETAAALLELAPAEQSEGRPAVEGLISPPDLTRANRGYIHCFVNRRWVQPRRIAYAVAAAYESLLPSGRQPIALLDIRLGPGEVDVNVHPTKSEVRFLHEREVLAAVYHAVRDRLAQIEPATAFSGSGAGGFAPSREAASAAQAQPMPLWRALSGASGHDRPVQAPAAALSPRPALPILRVVGQAGGLYVVAEGPDGMYLVDQHAAHERVLYEQILRRGNDGSEQQGALSPMTVELSPAQEETLAVHGDELRKQGFDLEAFGARSYLIRALPALLAGRDAARALADLLDDLSGEHEGVERGSLVTMTVACHAAVRAGKTMANEEMRELLRLLESCDLPRTCPHGRPTMIHLSNEALEREFRRR